MTPLYCQEISKTGWKFLKQKTECWLQKIEFLKRKNSVNFMPMSMLGSRLDVYARAR